MNNKLIQSKWLNITLNIIGVMCAVVWAVGSFNYKQFFYDLFDDEGKYCVLVTKVSRVFLMTVVVMIAVRVLVGVIPFWG